MGTDVIFFTSLEPEQQNILDKAENVIHEFENNFSRFIENNELDNFNNSKVKKLKVSKTMADLLNISKKYFLKTKGTYDPTIITSLERIGYDKNFADINFKEPGETKSIDVNKIRQEFIIRPKMIDLKIEGKSISRPEGFRVDFGGIGKGYIVDFISQEIFYDVENYWISAGGDILASGNQDKGIGFDIGVQNPAKPDDVIFYINTKGEKLGIATSGIIERGGVINNFKWHHIIDPRSGLPAVNDILSVTVISANAIKADIYAKTVLILGEKEGLNFIENEIDSACIIFVKNKETIFSKRVALYLKK